MARSRRRRSHVRSHPRGTLSSRQTSSVWSGDGRVERLEPRHLLAALFWDPDRIATNNVIATGAGLGGSGTWCEGGAAVWFNPALNGGAGGYVNWNSGLGDTAVFTGPAGGTVTISGNVGAAGVEFRSDGFVVTGGGFITAAARTTFTATAAGWFDSPLAGTGGITKTGPATLTLGATFSNYTGDTVVAAGMLDVRGTIQSHVKPVGGSVQGVMFYDPDVAAAVRESLGIDPNAWLTSTVIAQSPPLTSLTVNGSLVGDLMGITNLSALQTLTLIPGDYSATPQGLSSLTPLAGFTSLTSLSLHDVGLTDAVLGTLPSLPGLTCLDVRSNALSAVPASVANLPKLTTLLVHGNPLLTDNPQVGLAALKGKAIDVDVAPDRPETATSIADLAARLYHLPLKMLDYVTNTIMFQPYTGAMKGPLATLQTKAGNDWDTNSLLAALYGAAGISTRYVAGAIEVTESQLRDYVGTRDSLAAGRILGAAGLGYDQYANRFKHTWLEALVTAPATGVRAWVPIDASWKLRDFRPGLPGLLTTVPFSPLEADYLTSPVWQKKSTAEYYEAKVAAWLAQNRPDLTIADVGYDGPIRQQSFTSLPTGLPYAVVSQPAESARPSAIPAVAHFTVNIKLANGGSQLFGAAGVNLTLADVALSRLTIDPGLVGTGTMQTSRPMLRRDGATVATAPAVIGSPASTQLTLTIGITAPAGGTSYSRTFTRAADRFIAIGLNANQFSESLLVGKRAVANAQQLKQANGVAVDQDQAVGGLLDLAIAQYFTAADADEVSLAALTSAVPDRTMVALGIATSASSLSTTGTAGLQFPYLPADMGVDVPANVNGGFAIDASTTAIDLNRDLLMGYTNSALESLVLEELTNFESVSTTKAFQLAAAAAGGMGNLVEINAGNVANITALLPGVRAEIRNAIANTVKNGFSGVADYAGVTFTALVPRNELAVGGGTDAAKQWKGVGYTLKCVTSEPTRAYLKGKTVGYIIHGAVGSNPLVSYGGAASRVVAARPSLKPTVNVWSPDLGAGDPVNMATGGVYHEESDVEIPNLGVPLAFRRRYDSIHVVSGVAGDPVAWSDRGMGEGWSFSYADRFEVGVDGAGTATWFTDSGLRLVFTSGVSGFTNPTGVFGKLTGSAAAGFTWTDFDGNKTTFGPTVGAFCPIVSKSDRFGNGVKIDYVVGTNRISKVSDLRNPARWLSFAYNADARPHVTSVADYTGRTWTYAYGTDGRLVTATAASPATGIAGAVVRYAYHTDAVRRGLLASVTDPAGNITLWEYYANRRGFRVTDAEGLCHSFTYNLHRKQSAFINERGHASRYAYDDQGNLLELLQPDRTAERSTWLANGLKATSTDAYGATTSFAYDTATGKVKSVTDPAGSVTTFAYTAGTFRDIDVITRLNRPNDASDDNSMKFTYDASGFLTSRIDDFGPGRLNATTRYAVAAGGRGFIQSMTSPRGVATRFTYNTAGQVLSQVTDSSPGVTVTQSFTYDSRGNLLTRTDGNGSVTSFTFDALGRKTSETLPDPDGAGPLPAIVATFAYDVSGNLVSTTLGDGRVTRMAYDRRQREVRRTAADGTYTLVTCDPAGNKVTETDAMGRVTRYVYDARNRLVATVYPDGTSTRLRVDGGGRLVATLDQAGATTAYAYDKLGRKTRETQPDPDGSGPLSAPATAWGYDSRGNLAYVTPFVAGQSGVTVGDPAWSTHYEYDALGRKTKQTQADPDGPSPLVRPVTMFSYDADGNLLSVTDPRGFTTGYAYDNLGRKITETSADPDGTGPLGPLVKRYVYDKADNLRFELAPGGVSETDVAFTTEHVYDALDREIRTILPDPDGLMGPLARPTSSRSFNASGLLASTTDALDRKTIYAYDRLGRVLTVTNAIGATVTAAYDAVGNKVIAADALGRREFSNYDVMNRPVAVHSPRPDAASATPVRASFYDVTGNLIASRDALGRTSWRQYDALGRMIRRTSPLGLFVDDLQATTRTEYDAAGRVTATIDELGRRTDTIYDNLGRKIRVLAPDAGQGRPTTHFGYDAAGNLRYTTDPRGSAAGDVGFTTWFFYDTLGRKTATVDALGPDWPVTAIPAALPSTVTTNVTRTAYDARGRTASTTDVLGQSTDYAYDNLGRKVSETAPAPATGIPRPVTRYGYDAVGNKTSVTDPLGNVTAYAYDALDRRTTVTDARGFSTATTCDVAGNTTSLTDASGNVTRYAFDRRNQLITETDPLGAVTRYAYDAVGNKTRETDRLGRVTTFVYDAADRLVQEQWQQSASAGVFHTIKKVYDAASQLLGVTETDATAFATTAWQFSYDALGNVIKSRMAPGEIVQQPISWSGSLAVGDVLIDWDGDGKGERYDVHTYMVAPGDVVDVTVSTTSRTFMPALLLQRSSKPTELVWFESAPGVFQLATSRTADTAETWYLAVTARDENATDVYDIRIVKNSNSIVSTALVEYDYVYDKAGNLLSATEDQAAVGDMYGFGQAASGLGVRTSFTLDALNRVTRYEQASAAGGQVTKRADYAYRADRSVGSVRRFAGPGMSPIGTSTAAYDGMGRIAGITHTPAASQSVAYRYTYDAASRITSMTTPEGTSSFALDVTNQLLSASVTGEAYAYDNTGNRTSSGTQTGTGNRLLADGIYRYAYDAEGNQTAKFIDKDNSGTLSAGDADVTAYGYDQRNRLVAVSQVAAWTSTQAAALGAFVTTGLPGSDLELRYTYDYADRRIRRMIDTDGIAGAGQESVSFAGYAGDVRTLEIARPNDKLVIDGTGKVFGFSGQVVQRNFYGNGVDEILAVDKVTWNGTTPATTSSWTFTDHQDSVRDIVSGNAGSLGQAVEHRQYDSFGKIVRRTNGPQAGAPSTAGVGIDFGYAGRPLEDRTGLSDNRARWYEPSTGRFINEDPSGFKGGDANLFRYVGNDPLNQVDPSGLTAAWANYAGKSTISVAPALTVSTNGGTVYTPVATSRPAVAPSTPYSSLRTTVSDSRGTVYAPSSIQAFASYRPVESPRWTAADREAKLAATAAYSINDGGLLRTKGINYDPTGKTGAYGRDGFSASLTYSEKAKTYYLAFRGTETGWAGVSDWWANIAQGLGFRTAQYEQAILLAAEVKRKLGDVRLEVTGHSLGGSLAAAASYALGLKATVFNPASVSAVYRQGSPGDIRSHIVFGDILSVGRTIANGLPDPTSPNPNLRFAPGEVIVHPAKTWSINRHPLDQLPD